MTCPLISMPYASTNQSHVSCNHVRGLSKTKDRYAAVYDNLLTICIILSPPGYHLIKRKDKIYKLIIIRRFFIKLKQGKLETTITQ